MELLITNRLEKKVPPAGGIPFPKATLKGHPVGFPEGDYWILSGEVSDGSVVVRPDALSYRLEDACCQKAAGLPDGSRVTVLLCGENVVDLRVGPYFGKVSWIFTEEGKHSATEVSIIKES